MQDGERATNDPLPKEGTMGKPKTVDTKKDVMNIAEAAALLEVAVSTLYKLVHEDKVPYKKVGGAVRFSRQCLLDWIAGGESETHAAKRAR